MAQTPNTTPNLGLNQWGGNDPLNTPQFNMDNSLIDAAVGKAHADIDTALSIANRIYEGVDLTVRHATEIAAAPFDSNPWAWIQARIRAENWNNINVGDFIPFQIGEHTILAEIAGMNTYKRYGDGAFEVGNHIDFISRDCFPEVRRFNRANYNNGTTVSQSPWLASDLFAWLNGLQRQVPNGATANPPLITVDYRTAGLFPRLPAALRDVIVQKRAMLESRFTTGALLIDNNNWGWGNAGNLWIPSEMEVYGTSVWGSVISPNHGFGSAAFIHYPIFANNMKRVKGTGHEGTRFGWWLLNARGGYNGWQFTYVGNFGHASTHNATTERGVPVCFRIA